MSTPKVKKMKKTEMITEEYFGKKKKHSKVKMRKTPRQLKTKQTKQKKENKQEGGKR